MASHIRPPQQSSTSTSTATAPPPAMRPAMRPEMAAAATPAARPSAIRPPGVRSDGTAAIGSGEAGSEPPAVAQFVASMGTTTMKDGSKGSSVHSLQNALRASGFSVDADAKFGPKTEATVKRFQALHGLKPDGIVGPKTRAAFGNSLVDMMGAAELSRGSSGTPVRAMQQALRESGIDLKLDGKFGPQTAGALRTFQAQHGIAATGKLDAATRTAMANRIKPIMDGETAPTTSARPQPRPVPRPRPRPSTGSTTAPVVADKPGDLGTVPNTPPPGTATKPTKPATPNKFPNTPPPGTAAKPKVPNTPPPGTGTAPATAPRTVAPGLRSRHHDDDKFVPLYAATAFSESNTYRSKTDPYAVGAISQPTRKQDLGGQTYGTYQFESSVYKDGSKRSEKHVANSTLMRFARDKDNPYSEEMMGMLKKHGPGSSEFNTYWKGLATTDNKNFGLAQEAFMEKENRDKIDRFFKTARVSDEARKDPRLADVVMGSLNQYGGLANGQAAHLGALAAKSKTPMTADEVGVALQRYKHARVGSNFKSSPGAHKGIYNRIQREGRMFVGYDSKSPTAPPKPNKTAPTTSPRPQARPTQADASKPPATGATTDAKDPDAAIAPGNAAPQETADIDALLSADWGTKTFGRGDASESQTKMLQSALISLGYLPKDATADGKFGPNTANALMSFQVATSGVDSVALGKDKNGKDTFATDSTRNRLQGVVDGRVGPGTRGKLQAALRAERQRRLSGEKEPGQIRSMGDNPQQKADIARRLREQGKDPAAVMSIDVAQFKKLGLRPHVLESAIDAWENQFASGKVTNTTITVNDFELPDNMRRSFTIDLANPSAGMKQHEAVAHGVGSGSTFSGRFSRSQIDGSRQSVLGGSLVGARAYPGSKRHGLTVDGLERGINDKADPRLIRTHAPTNQSRMKERDIIGLSNSYKSWGCMVMEEEASKRYRRETRAEGGRFNFNFAPHDHYWGKTNDVNRD